MKFLTTKPRLISLLIIWIIIISCDNGDENNISIMGTAQYIETGLAADEIPIKLRIFASYNPFRAQPGDAVYTDETITDKEGHYKFSFNRAVLPEIASYMLSITTDSLIITGEITPCSKSGSAGGNFSTSSEIIRDLKIDYPTYLQITFDKLNNMTGDRVILTRPSCSLAVFETTIEKPDTTILEKMHYHYFKKVDIKYYILKENEETIDYVIGDVILLKNDTTKLTIEY